MVIVSDMRSMRPYHTGTNLDIYICICVVVLFLDDITLFVLIFFNVFCSNQVFKNELDKGSRIPACHRHGGLVVKASAL